jgi:hypothetical protein
MLEIEVYQGEHEFEKPKKTFDFKWNPTFTILL